MGRTRVFVGGAAYGVMTATMFGDLGVPEWAYYGSFAVLMGCLLWDEICDTAGELRDWAKKH